MATIDTLLTAEEYALLPEAAQPTELVRGQIVMMNVPYSRHGAVCSNVDFALRQFLARYDIGRALTNDSGIITEREPDTVRGADVAFYSYARCPKGPLPRRGYIPAAPEVVFEVRSPDDRWPAILRKISEYLTAGVLVVCVVDPDDRVLHLYRADKPPETLQEGDDLLLPELHADFRVQVSQLLD